MLDHLSDGDVILLVIFIALTLFTVWWWFTERNKQ